MLRLATVCIAASSSISHVGAVNTWLNCAAKRRSSSAAAWKKCPAVCSSLSGVMPSGCVQRCTSAYVTCLKAGVTAATSNPARFRGVRVVGELAIALQSVPSMP
eukprot:TRINITY_DN83848_c0_g1_i1.p2 TRINITY_DN83848_c0_g1~~TRINITY_DN83848_c0_g1_i1.p2  ORF type:complete len:104 (+),score=6.17 TRINITY_DN83848_c0_g1_i1:373-684(+)